MNSDQMGNRVRISAISSVAIGLGVLVGWVWDISALKSVLPGLVTMKVNTALGMILCGLALALLSGGGAGRPHRMAASALGVVVIILGGLSFLEELVGWNLGIDQWLVHDNSNAVGAALSGRMSPATAFSFLLMGTALVCSAPVVLKASRYVISLALGAVIVAMGAASAIGLLLIFFLNFHFWNYTGMALPTSASFVFLGFGLMDLARRKGGQSWYLDSGATAGFVVGTLSILALAGVSYCQRTCGIDPVSDV